MTDKMKFSYGGLGAGVETEIVAPKIQNKCPKCRYRILLKKRSPVRPSKPIKAR